MKILNCKNCTYYYVFNYCFIYESFIKRRYAKKCKYYENSYIQINKNKQIKINNKNEIKLLDKLTKECKYYEK